MFCRGCGSRDLPLAEVAVLLVLAGHKMRGRRRELRRLIGTAGERQHDSGASPWASSTLQCKAMVDLGAAPLLSLPVTECTSAGDTGAAEFSSHTPSFERCHSAFISSTARSLSRAPPGSCCGHRPAHLPPERDGRGHTSPCEHTRNLL